MDREAFTTGSAKAITHIFAVPVRIREIATHRLLDLFAAAEQPEHDEEGHHGGHKIGIGYLPGPPVVAPMPDLLPADDDDLLRRLCHDYAAFAAPLHADSMSLNDGLRSCGMARRANSTAIIGAIPLANAISPARSIW